MYAYTQIYAQSTHDFRVSFFGFFLRVFPFSLSPLFFLHTRCRQRHVTTRILCNCWLPTAYMLIYDCNHDYARVYLVIWSLRASTQDWVAKACAHMPDASKSLVGASTHLASYSRMSMRTVHDREGNIYLPLHIGADNHNLFSLLSLSLRTCIYIFKFRTTILPSFSICSPLTPLFPTIFDLCLHFCAAFRSLAFSHIISCNL